MGGTGDSPVPVGDPPTGRSRRPLPRGVSLLAPSALLVPPGRRAGESNPGCEQLVHKFSLLGSFTSVHEHQGSAGYATDIVQVLWRSAPAYPKEPEHQC